MMARLTFEGNFCEIARCKEVKCPYDTDCSQKQVWERLKQYEDTKRTPEQIETLEAAIMGKAVAQITEFEGLPIERLRELAMADQEGRVIVQPCKRGDELWTFCNYPGKRVYSFTVSDVSTLNGRTVLNTQGLGTIRSEDIGKTVFLTRAEAEKALEELEGKKDG